MVHTELKLINTGKGHVDSNIPNADFKLINTEKEIIDSNILDGSYIQYLATRECFTNIDSIVQTIEGVKATVWSDISDGRDGMTIINLRLTLKGPNEDYWQEMAAGDCLIKYKGKWRVLHAPQIPFEFRPRSRYNRHFPN